MENFKRIEQKPTAKISLPQAEAVISLYKEKFEDNPERIEKLKEIFDVFLEQSLTNSDVYSSKELKASFPWTVVRLQDIAKKLFKKNYKGDQVFNIENTDEEITKNKKLEFIFGSAFAYSHGDAFAFTEEAMHQIIKRLPSAIKALQQGLEPEDFEVFTLGMPTNTFGEISTDFSDNLKKDSYEYMGRLYSEFVTEKTASEKDVKQNIKFYGISMGGGFAAKTGEKLLENKVVTQESENVDGVSVENKPYLQIQSMVPVSMGRSWIKPVQIPLGFATEGVVETISNPAIKKIGEGMGEFIAQMTLALEKKDIHPKMSPEQKDLKKKALISIITGLGKKLDINPEVKLTRVVGLEDLTMYTPSFNKEAKEHRKVNLQENNNIETLGNKLVTREVENQRTFGVDMRHTIPFFRENEFKRMQKATMALEDLKNV